MAAAAAILKPRPRTDPVRWAIDNRKYDETSGRPGPRDPYYTPYVVPIAMAIHGRTHKRVVGVISAQSGKTEVLLDVIGERLDSRPTPMLYVGPSKQFLTEQVEGRIMNLLESTSLKSGMAPPSRQRKTRKFVNGVPIRLAHGGSSTALKSDPFGFAVTDEVDELMSNINHQGNPIGLIDARGDTYDDFVHAIISTPSQGMVDVELDDESGLEFWAVADPEEIRSPVWRLWQSGTRHHWAWPCPQCEQYFIPRFSCLAWEKPMGKNGKPGLSTPVQARNTAHIVCPHCGFPIKDTDACEHDASLTQKEWMNANGVFVAPGQRVEGLGTVVGTPPESWTLSYWVSGLATPFVSWGERAARYVEAVRSGDPSDIQSVRNQGFAELYLPGAVNNLDPGVVRQNCIDYRMGEIPDWVMVLVLTADVQRDRILYVIRGYGPDGNSALIVADELNGDTGGKAIWDDLATVLTDTYDGIPIRFAFVDSGFRPGKKDEVPEHRVYSFARRFPHLVRATKGSSSAMIRPIIVSKIDIKQNGKLIKNGLELVRLDPDHWKAYVHQKLKWDPETPGAWFLPSDISDDYCRQILSEQRVRMSTGQVKFVRRNRENHYLDCEAMQGAAAQFLNLSKLRAGPRGRVRNTAGQGDQLQQKQKSKPRSSGYWGNGSIWS